MELQLNNFAYNESILNSIIINGRSKVSFNAKTNLMHLLTFPNFAASVIVFVVVAVSNCRYFEKMIINFKKIPIHPIKHLLILDH